MLKVYIGNNVERYSYTINEQSTLREACIEAESANGFDWQGKLLQLDGGTLSAGDLDKTFVEMGYDGNTDKAVYLTSVKKADNA